MTAIDRTESLVLKALRALPPEPGPPFEEIRQHAGDVLADLAALREQRGPADTTRATRAGGRLLLTALLAQRDATARGAAPSRSAGLLIDACSALLEFESAPPKARTIRNERPVLRSHEEVRAHLDQHGNLRGVQIVGVQATFALAGVDLSASEWIDVDGGGSDLHEANAAQTTFTKCLFAGANLSGVRLENARLPGADLTNANLRGASLVRCLLVDANGEGADLESCDLTDAALKRARLRGVTGSNVRAHRASFAGADLRTARLTGLDAPHADMREAIFEGADLTGACLRDAALERAVLRRVIARDVVFDRARLVAADIRSSSLAGASLRHADLSHALLDKSTLVGATLANANLHRTSREGADLTDADLRGTRPTDPERARAEDFRRAT